MKKISKDFLRKRLKHISGRTARSAKAVDNNRIFEMSVPDLEESGSQVGVLRFPPNYISKISSPERGSKFDEVKLVIYRPAVIQLYSINDCRCSMVSELQSEFFFRFSHIIVSS